MLIKLFGVAAVAAACSIATQTPPARNAWVAGMAAQDPVSVTMALAHAGVPSGLEIRGQAIPKQRPPQLAGPAPKPVDVASVVAAFNSGHSDYQAAIMDGVLVIRPVQGRAPYLDSRPALQPIVATGVMSAARRVFAPLVPIRQGGQLSSVIGVTSEESGEHAAMSVATKGRTVVEMLNQIVKASPRAWLVETDSLPQGPAVTAFGFVHARGSVTRHSVYPVGDGQPAR